MKRQTQFLRISEWLYLVIGTVSLVEMILVWKSDRTKALVFGAFLLLSILMVYVRRTARKRLERSAPGSESNSNSPR